MIYNDVKMCLLFSETRPTFCMNNLGFLWNACHVQHLSLFSDINNCDYACPCMASLKEETQWNIIFLLGYITVESKVTNVWFSDPSVSL